MNDEVDYVVPPENSTLDSRGKSAQVSKSASSRPIKIPNQTLGKAFSWAKNNTPVLASGGVMAVVVALVAITLYTGQRVSLFGYQLNPLYQQASCPLGDPRIDCAPLGGDNGGEVIPVSSDRSVTAPFADGTVNKPYTTYLSITNYQPGGAYACDLSLEGVNAAITGAQIVPVLTTDNPTAQPQAAFSATPTTAGSYVVTIGLSCSPTNGSKMMSTFIKKDFTWKVLAADGSTPPGGGPGGSVSTCRDPVNVNNLAPIYRYWKASDGDHFFTTNSNERPAGYVAEGIAGYVFKTQISGTVPIYRSYKRAITAHYYSTVDNATNFGFTNEGIIGYAYPQTTIGAVPWYRLYKVPPTDDFLETVSTSEKAAAIAMGYVDKGIVANICAP
ncbi:MAG TPA: hypothetical protein VHQ41_00370 [Patescibacteria group bacterium]|jgi:hypothetical protein|nr:hypothetical protein [Patescibacteria group bacterium]